MLQEVASVEPSGDEEGAAGGELVAEFDELGVLHGQTHGIRNHIIHLMRTPISLTRLVVVARVKTEQDLQLPEERPFV